MNRRGGFTLIELLIVIALAGVIASKVFLVMRQASETQSSSSRAMVLEDQVMRVLDRIAYAIIGASRDSITPEASAPLFSNTLEYRISLGFEDGEVVWSEPEQIGLDPSDPARLVWVEAPDTESERSVVWCNYVRPFLEEELPNSIDDNANEVIDEAGLAFVLSGDSVTIRLTLEREGPGGAAMSRTRETTVSCRN